MQITIATTLLAAAGLAQATRCGAPKHDEKQMLALREMTARHLNDPRDLASIINGALNGNTTDPADVIDEVAANFVVETYMHSVSSTRAGRLNVSHH